MSTRVAERRRSRRAPAVHPIAIFDNDGYVLARGRTSDMSECGVYIIVSSDWAPELNSTVTVELKLPGFASERRRDRQRIVIYSARVVRTREVAQFLGVGLELLEKLR